MGRGGKTTGTWPKGKKPPVKRPKGSKNKKTLVKEAIGLKNWDTLKAYLETDGSGKMLDAMKKMNDRDFKYAFISLMDFVKPKLTRVDAKVKNDIDLTGAVIKFK